MKIISIVSRKGGAGKTSCTANIAYALSKNGIDVAVADLDPSEDLSRRMCLERQPTDAKVTHRKATITAKGPSSLPEVLKELDESGIEVCLIDFPGKLDESNKSVIQFLEAGDVVIVPVSESLDGLRALLAVRQVFLQSIVSGGVSFLALRNMWPPNPTYLSNIQDDLLSQQGIETLKTAVSFKKAAFLKAEGLNGYVGYPGLRAKSSVQEFEEIAQELIKRMKLKRRGQRQK